MLQWTEILYDSGGPVLQAIFLNSWKDKKETKFDGLYKYLKIMVLQSQWSELEISL